MSATITWMGHSAVRLVLADGRVIFIDPWLAENPACPDELKSPDRCDVVLLTHGHFDHVGDVAALVKRFKPVVVGNYDLCTVLGKRVAGGRFAPMNTGGTQDVGGVRVTLTRAFHSSAFDGAEGTVYAGSPNGVVVRAGGLATVYHAGDTDVFSDMKLIARLHAPKIALLPIGDLFTMGAAGAALAAEFLQPNVIIPIHYKTFPILAQSADALREALPEGLKDRLIAPEVGEELRWTAEGVEA